MIETVVLFGAARSGTKILRDVLGTAPGACAVPYDINYVWSAGNESATHDEFELDSIGNAERADIRQRIANYANEKTVLLEKTVPLEKTVLLEKTVSNSIRPDFVKQVLPDARYLVLLRDGYDVTESSMRQWTAKPDLAYILEKARQFPIRQSPRYAWRYAVGLLKGSVGDTVPSWGPRYAGIDEDIATKSLAEVCAIQWARSVNLTLDAVEHWDETVAIVGYGEFVNDPAATVQAIAAELGLACLADADTATVRAGEQGKSQRALSNEDRDLIAPIVDPVNARIDTVLKA